MSTRSRIGILLPDDSILSVYHHWDGYPEWLGVCLNQHYNTYEKVTELIDGGDMGSCYSDNEYNEENWTLRLGEANVCFSKNKLDNNYFHVISNENEEQILAFRARLLYQKLLDKGFRLVE